MNAVFPPQLSPSQQSDFHQILRSAARANVPLELNGCSIDELQNELHKHYDERGCLTDISNHPSADFPPTYLIALSIFATTGRSDLVLDRLTLAADVNDELASVSRSVWLYVALMCLVASAGMAVYAVSSAPVIRGMRADMRLVPRHDVSQMPFAVQHAATIAVALAGITCILVGLVWATGFAAWSTQLLGGNRYRQSRYAALRKRIELSTREFSNPTTLATRDARNLVSSRLAKLRIVVPMTVLVLVGGLGVMTYCWLLFTPLISLIHDLSTTINQGGY